MPWTAWRSHTTAGSSRTRRSASAGGSERGSASARSSLWTASSRARRSGLPRTSTRRGRPSSLLAYSTTRARSGAAAASAVEVRPDLVGGRDLLAQLVARRPASGSGCGGRTGSPGRPARARRAPRRGSGWRAWRLLRCLLEPVAVQPPQQGGPDLGQHVLRRAAGALQHGERVVGLRRRGEARPAARAGPRGRGAGPRARTRRACPARTAAAPRSPAGGPRAASRTAPGGEAGSRGRRGRPRALPPPPPARRSSRPSTGRRGRRAARPVASRAKRGRGAGRGLEDGRRVGPARALLGVGEVVEAGRAPGGGEGLGEGLEHGVAAVAPGPVAEHDDGRSPAVERGARLGAGDRAAPASRRSIPRSGGLAAPGGTLGEPPAPRVPERVRVLVRLPREALQPHAGPEVPLPVPEARRGLRPPRVRPARARRLHPRHRRGGHRQDDARALLPLEAGPRHPHRVRPLPRPHRRRAPPHDPRRPAREAGGGLEEEPRGRAPPLPARVPGRRTATSSC